MMGPDMYLVCRPARLRSEEEMQLRKKICDGEGKEKRKMTAIRPTDEKASWKSVEV